MTKKKEFIPQVDGIYFATNYALKIGNKLPTNGHSIIVTSIDKQKKTARVKTITSLEDYDRKRKKWFFRNSTLDDVRKGNILVIPQSQLKSSHLSGVHHSTKTISWDEIRPKSKKNQTRFPTRYKKLIHRK